MENKFKQELNKLLYKLKQELKPIVPIALNETEAYHEIIKLLEGKAFK